MKSTITALVVLLMLALFACVSWGQGLPKEAVSVGDNNVVVPESIRTETEVYCQTWNESGCVGGWTSQIDTGPLNIQIECAEDFVSNTNGAITSLVWWGAQPTGATPPDYFVITFYAYGDDCSQPDTGIIISQQSIYAYNQQPTGVDIYYAYSGTLDPVLMDEGRQYWISIRAVLNVEEIGDPVTWSTQWFWAMYEEVVECPALFTSTYWGFLDWTMPSTADPDYRCADAFAFCLYTDMAVSAESRSWGELKALFR